MIKLTVIHNLPPGADHEEFIKWRTTTHQESNMSILGVMVGPGRTKRGEDAP